MTIFDNSSDSNSVQSSPFSQASFQEHLPSFMLQTTEDAPVSTHESDCTLSPQICSERDGIKKTSDEILDQTIIEYTELATEQNDQVLEEFLERADVDGAHQHILKTSFEMLKSNNFEVSMRYAYSAIISCPLEMEAYMIYASSLSGSEEYEEALKWLEETKTFFPEEPIIYKECYFTAKKMGDEKQTQEALLNWIKADKTNIDAWIEMIEKEKADSLEQALETTKKVLESHPRDLKLILKKGELEEAILTQTTSTLSDSGSDMDIVDSPDTTETHAPEQPLTKSLKKQQYPYLFNPLSQRGTRIDEIEVSNVEREIWRRKLKSIYDFELSKQEGKRNLHHEHRKSKIRESRKLVLEQNRERSLGFTKPLEGVEGRRSLNPTIRSIVRYSTEKSEELQDRKLQFANTIESRRAVTLSRDFCDKAQFFIQEFQRNGIDPMEVINSLVKLGSFHHMMRRPYEWRCHIIPIQRRSRQDNLLGAIIAGVNLTQKTGDEVYTFLKLLNRVNNIITPKICLLARINCEALSSSRAGNASVHNFLWNDLQQRGMLTTDPFEDVLRRLQFQGYKIKIYSKNAGEEVLIDNADTQKTIRLLKTKIGEHFHYDLLYPQFESEPWNDGILIENCLLRNGMSRDDIAKSKISISLNHGISLQTHQFDVIPLICNPNNHNFYQAVVAGMNCYQHQITFIKGKLKSLLVLIDRTVNESDRLNERALHASSRVLHEFVLSIQEQLNSFQIEVFSQKFREMIPLLNTFDRGIQQINDEEFLNLLMETHSSLRKFHRVIGDLQSNINHMKMEHDRSYPPPSVIARKDPNALFQTNLNSTSTYHWLWKAIQQNGELKLIDSDKRYTDLEDEQIPDAIRADLARLGYQVLIWVKGNLQTRSPSANFNFNNPYLLPAQSNLKTIHLLQSEFSVGKKHYDLLIPRESVQPQPLPPVQEVFLKKRAREEDDDTQRGTPNKRQFNHSPLSYPNTVTRKRDHEQMSDTQRGTPNKRHCNHPPHLHSRAELRLPSSQSTESSSRAASTQESRPDSTNSRGGRGGHRYRGRGGHRYGRGGPRYRGRGGHRYERGGHRYRSNSDHYYSRENKSD